MAIYKFTKTKNATSVFSKSIINHSILIIKIILPSLFKREHLNSLNPAHPHP